MHVFLYFFDFFQIFYYEHVMLKSVMCYVRSDLTLACLLLKHEQFQI